MLTRMLDVFDAAEFRRPLAIVFKLGSMLPFAGCIGIECYFFIPGLRHTTVAGFVA